MTSKFSTKVANRHNRAHSPVRLRFRQNPLRQIREKIGQGFYWLLSWDTALAELVLGIMMIVFSGTFTGEEWRDDSYNPVREQMLTALTMNQWVIAMAAIGVVRVATVLLDASTLGTRATTMIRMGMTLIASYWWLWMYEILQDSTVPLPGIYQPKLYCAVSFWAFLHLLKYGGGVVRKGGKGGSP